MINTHTTKEKRTINRLPVISPPRHFAPVILERGILYLKRIFKIIFSTNLINSWFARAFEKSLKKYHVFEKSLKVEKLWNILEKSLNFPQKALNIV